MASSVRDEAARLLLYIRVVVYIFGNIVLSLDSPHQERMMIKFMNHNFYRPDRRDVWAGFRTCALSYER